MASVFHGFHGEFPSFGVLRQRLAAQQPSPGSPRAGAAKPGTSAWQELRRHFAPPRLLYETPLPQPSTPLNIPHILNVNARPRPMPRTPITTDPVLAALPRIERPLTLSDGLAAHPAPQWSSGPLGNYYVSPQTLRLSTSRDRASMWAAWQNPARYATSPFLDPRYWPLWARDTRRTGVVQVMNRRYMRPERPESQRLTSLWIIKFLNGRTAMYVAGEWVGCMGIPGDLAIGKQVAGILP